MTEERFKEHMTLFQVRPGNCMVALERQQPVGVVVSTKRDYGVWIQALGCQPAFQRRGIASQLLPRRGSLTDVAVNLFIAACFQYAA